MAGLETNELYAETTRSPIPRMVPREDSVVPRAFDAISGGLSAIPAGTPVARNTSTGLWERFTQGGTNGTNVILGFLMEEGRLNDSGSNDTEVLLNVMIAGTVHRDDINTAAIIAKLPTVTLEQLDTALLAIDPARFIVQGVTGIPND